MVGSDYEFGSCHLHCSSFLFHSERIPIEKPKYEIPRKPPIEFFKDYCVLASVSIKPDRSRTLLRSHHNISMWSLVKSSPRLARACRTHKNLNSYLVLWVSGSDLKSSVTFKAFVMLYPSREVILGNFKFSFARIQGRFGLDKFIANTLATF